MSGQRSQVGNQKPVGHKCPRKSFSIWSKWSRVANNAEKSNNRRRRCSLDQPHRSCFRNLANTDLGEWWGSKPNCSGQRKKYGNQGVKTPFIKKFDDIRREQRIIAKGNIWIKEGGSGAGDSGDCFTWRVLSITKCWWGGTGGEGDVKYIREKQDK